MHELLSAVPPATSKILLVQWGSRRAGFDNAGTVESIIQKACAHYRLDAYTAEFTLVGEVNGVYRELSDHTMNHFENGSIVLLTRAGLAPSQSNFVSARPYYYGHGLRPMGHSSYSYPTMYQWSLGVQAFQELPRGLDVIQVNLGHRKSNPYQDISLVHGPCVKTCPARQGRHPAGPARSILRREAAGRREAVGRLRHSTRQHSASSDRRKVRPQALNERGADRVEPPKPEGVTRLHARRRRR
ncbi:hypothetical protein C8Q80DRAFT_672618 [Daedaleopsis nitida]|nr:hypothetical protein C8Q80DRAFT_672618 [Daedaleopsis nitida]